MKLQTRRLNKAANRSSSGMHGQPKSLGSQTSGSRANKGSIERTDQTIN